jgi:hypothetical protein
LNSLIIRGIARQVIPTQTFYGNDFAVLDELAAAL